MPISRQTGLDVSVFSIGGTDFLCDLQDCTLSVEVATENARGVCDEWDYAWATSRGWSLSGTLFVSSAASLMTEAISGDTLVAISFNSGANAYSGNGIVTQASQNVSRDGLQTISVTIAGQDTLVIS